MNNELMISLIVPVYNGASFVRRAIDSVIAQMDGQIELILVNDGSTDTSGAICDEYAAQNPFVHVIHKENAGTSSAKNRGIAQANGRYICFMDCDDYLDSDTYSTIIPLLKTFEPDILDFGLKYIDSSGVVYNKINQLEKNYLFQRNEWSPLVLPPLLNLKKDDAHFIFDFAVNKVFKADIIRQHGLRFDEDKRTWEDRTFLLRHLKHCETFYSLDKCFYNYVYVPNSLSQRYTLDYFRIILANFQHYRELFGDQFDFDTQYVKDYWARAIQNMIFLSLEQTENADQIRNNIIETLQHELVIHWFSGRESQNSFEKVLSQCIAEHKLEQAFCLCKKQQKANKRREACTRLVARAKGLLRRIARV